uniref:Uncharacterized protein n=1 Tax=Arundo donax TaxID=35708 RepID=A0A0A9GMH7_ARUDO
MLATSWWRGRRQFAWARASGAGGATVAEQVAAAEAFGAVRQGPVTFGWKRFERIDAAAMTSRMLVVYLSW